MSTFSETLTAASLPSRELKTSNPIRDCFEIRRWNDKRKRKAVCRLTPLASLTENLLGFSELIMRHVFFDAILITDQISLQMSFVRTEPCALAGAPAGFEMGEQEHPVRDDMMRNLKGERVPFKAWRETQLREII